jgi:molecular chaperone GrpE (heat shock protein)
LFEETALLTEGLEGLENTLRQYRRHSAEGLQNRLSRAYNQQRGLEQQYWNLLLEMIGTVDLCEQLSDSPEALATVRDRLLTALARQDIISWEPEEGQPIPEGCKVISDIVSDEVAPGTVAGTVTPGYRRSDGLVFREPNVLRAVQPPTRKEVYEQPALEEVAEICGGRSEEADRSVSEVAAGKGGDDHEAECDRD